jgi:hypothetical protein
MSKSQPKIGDEGGGSQVGTLSRWARGVIENGKFTVGVIRMKTKGAMRRSHPAYGAIV